ncbi:MAG: hypothetical protein QF662_02995 [Phycisphaerae bacterium]|nr:hypothetical protein [Phycisphaerae bacterium]
MRYEPSNGKQMYRDQTPHPSRMADWSKFWRMFVVRYKDVVRALNFWNEPWEHGGISSWHCDGAHFRRMLKATWEGIHDLRPKVLFAAADSAHNTDWKIFAADYEKYVDVLSNHYAPPWANYCPALARRGKKKVWETESWLGLRPDHTVIRRTINILAHGSTMVSLWHQNNFTRGRGIDFGQLPNGVAGVRGGPTPNVVPTSALTHFLEDTKFDKRVSADGLPFMFLFKGKGRSVCAVTSAINPGKPWDQACEAWQASEGIENGKPPPSGAKPFGIRSKGSITLKDPGRKLQAFDMYGNSIRQKGKGQLTVPVSHEVVYVTSKGKHGEFAKALSGASMKGIRPVQIILHDFAAPMDMLPSLDVELRNAYNVPIHGRITVTAPEGLEFENADRKFKIGKAHGRLNIAFKLKSARASRFNAYPVKVKVETDQGVAGLEEVLSVTCAVKGTPTIDGNLDDWQALGAIPVIFVSGVGNPMSIPVWEPWSKVAKRWRGKFAARCATMWDDKYFYFMADVQDDSKACHESLFFSGDLNKYRPPPYEHVYERFGPEPEWATNSVQLAFDCGLWTKPKQFYNIHAPEDPLWGTGPVYSADYSYALYPTKKHEPELFRYRREDFYWAHALPIDYKWVARHCRVKGARLAMKSNRAGYRYEVALPLAEVRRLEPKVGKGFRFSFQVSSGGPFNNINWSAWKSACFKTALDFEPTHTANWSGNAPWSFVGPRK